VLVVQKAICSFANINHTFGAVEIMVVDFVTQFAGKGEEGEGACPYRTDDGFSGFVDRVEIFLPRATIEVGVVGGWVSMSVGDED
jgi:hypothetical protein